MPTSLVLLPRDVDGAPTPAAGELLTAARTLVGGTGEVAAVWVGPAGDPALEPLAEVAGRFGATTLVHAVSDDDPAVAAVQAAALLVALAGPAAAGAVVLLEPGPVGQEAAARVAVGAGCGVVTDADALTCTDGEVTVTKTVLAGSWVTTVAVHGPAVVTLKPNAVHPAALDEPVRPALTEVDVPPVPAPVAVTRTRRLATGRPALTSADVVVVAGRGIDGDVALVEALADELGAAVGGTRVVVDEGWLDRSLQVGQTGVTVAPRLYVGVGVSGQVHHRGGMQASGTVVAVNTDPDAPIFEVADYGVVGDLRTVVPELTAELHRLRG